VIVGPHSILLDSEALSAFADDGRQMQAWATVARRTDSTLHTSAVTLAEVTDGTARDARVRRAANALRVEEVTEEIGYNAGRLRASAASRRKARDMTVDAVVAATALALHGPVVVLTTDDGDLELLLADTRVKVERVGKR
jgi:predicted nucleic acid-binding protein